MIKELLFEGSNRYYDQALCTGLNVTDEDIDALCKAMKEQAVKNARTEEQKASIKDVGRQQLRSWGILIERDGKDYPSNAFAILTGTIYEGKWTKQAKVLEYMGGGKRTFKGC